ncbi:hypothetical protein L9F63_011154, partial [Diploptera punctata]
RSKYFKIAYIFEKKNVFVTLRFVALCYDSCHLLHSLKISCKYFMFSSVIFAYFITNLLRFTYHEG